MPPSKPRKNVTFSAARFNRTIKQIQNLTKEQVKADAERGRIRSEYNQAFADEFTALANDLDNGVTPYLTKELVKMFRTFAVLLTPPPAPGAEPPTPVNEK